MGPGHRVLTKLRARHAETAGSTYGINGQTGDIVDMQELGVWEPYAVKVRRPCTACWLLLRLQVGTLPSAAPPGCAPPAVSARLAPARQHLAVCCTARCTATPACSTTLAPIESAGQL